VKLKRPWKDWTEFIGFKVPPARAVACITVEPEQKDPRKEEALQKPAVPFWMLTFPFHRLLFPGFFDTLSETNLSNASSEVVYARKAGCGRNLAG
jgi:hypothetical protein